MGEEAFDLLFDRGMVFEGRGVRYKMDRDCSRTIRLTAEASPR
jgi:hypothetical protein